MGWYVHRHIRRLVLGTDGWSSRIINCRALTCRRKSWRGICSWWVEWRVNLIPVQIGALPLLSFDEQLMILAFVTLRLTYVQTAFTLDVSSKSPFYHFGLFGKSYRNGFCGYRWAWFIFKIKICREGRSKQFVEIITKLTNVVGPCLKMKKAAILNSKCKTFKAV